MAGSEEFKSRYNHAGHGHNFQPGQGPVPPSAPSAGLPSIINDEDELNFPAPGNLIAGNPDTESTAEYMSGDTEPFIRRNLRKKDRTKNTQGNVGRNEARAFGYYDMNRDYLYDDGKITYNAQGDKRLIKGIKKFGKKSGIKFEGVKKNAELMFNPGAEGLGEGVLGNALPHFFDDMPTKGTMKHLRKQGIEPGKGEAMHTINIAGYGSDAFTPYSDGGEYKPMNPKKGRKQLYHGVLGHEIGHALGLAHPTNLHPDKANAESLMSYGPHNQYSPKFSKSDMAMLNAIYN